MTSEIARIQSSTLFSITGKDDRKLTSRNTLRKLVKKTQKIIFLSSSRRKRRKNSFKSENKDVRYKLDYGRFMEQKAYI